MSGAPAGPTTQFGRLERRGVLLGLSGAQVAVVGVAAVIAVAAVYTSGTGGLVASAPLWGALLAAGTLSIVGRPVLSWVPVLGSWQARRAASLTSQVATAASRGNPDGLVLPGLGRPLELVEDARLSGVLVVDRPAGTVTGIVRVVGSGFVLDEPGVQGQKVTGWSRVLAGVCQQPAVVRVQLLARTVPGGLAPARRWWGARCTAASGPVVEALARMLDEGFIAPVRRETLLAIAVRAPRGGGRSGGDLTAVVAHLDAVAGSLQAADLTTDGWLGRVDLARVLQGAFDPEAAARGEDGPVSLTAPVGARERWASLSTGTAVHATYWVAQWPRSGVHAGFLQPLLLAGTGTLCVLAEPVATGKALAQIRRARVEHVADAATRARIGQIEDEATRAEVDDLKRREAELVAGHGDLRFTGLLTVSAPDEATLADRCTGLETAAAQAMLEVRRLVGQQGTAFLAAALPLARGVL